MTEAGGKKRKKTLTISCCIAPECVDNPGIGVIWYSNNSCHFSWVSRGIISSGNHGLHFFQKLFTVSSRKKNGLL